MSNNVIYTSQIGGSFFLEKQGDLSGKIVYFDKEETINKTIVLNRTKNLILDGLNNNFSCNVTFFVIGSGCENIEIRNFQATSNITLVNESVGIGNVDFQITNAKNVSQKIEHIYVHHNILRRFNIGISLGADSYPKGNGVLHGKVCNNYIYETQGVLSGKGYAVHLANADYCEVSNNYIEGSTRHAVYNAWGSHNRIYGNTIVRHRKNLDNDTLEKVRGDVRGAIAVYRDSQHILIENNEFIDNYNVSISIVSFIGEILTETQSNLANMNGITIRNNHFLNTQCHLPIIRKNSQIIKSNFPAIMIGTPSYNPYDLKNTMHWYIKDISIIGNKFENINTDHLMCIRCYQCDFLNITDNEFVFKAVKNNLDVQLSNLDENNSFENSEKAQSYSFNIISFEKDFSELTEMIANVSNNTFLAMNKEPNFSISAINHIPIFFNTKNRIRIKDNALINQKSGNTFNYDLYRSYIAKNDNSNHLGFDLQTEMT